MQTQQLIEDFLSKTTQPIHQKRINILSKMVVSAIANPKDIFLTNLGRNLDIQTSIKHKIKTADETPALNPRTNLRQ